MTDDEMRAFPEELGKMGFVFNFITYGGHQIDGVACRGVRHRAAAGRHACAGALAAQDAPGRVALPHTANPGRRAAQRCRAGRLLRAHRDHQGDGQGLDPASASGADRGAEEAAGGMAGAVERPLPARREAVACSYGRGAPAPTCSNSASTATAKSRWPTSVVDPIKDRHGRSILTVRDQNTFAEKLRQKRLMDVDPPLADPPLQGRRSCTTSRPPRTTSIRPRR